MMRIERRTWFLAASVLGLALAFLAGFVAGSRYIEDVMRGHLGAQAEGLMNFAIEELVWLRHGESEKAIDLLEVQIDNSIMWLVQQGDWESFDDSTRTSLVAARKYRETYPPETPSPHLERALASIPDEPLDPESYRPAVRRLLLEAEAEANGSSRTPTGSR